MNGNDNAIWGPWATLLLSVLVLILTNVAAYFFFLYLFSHADSLPFTLPPADQINTNNGFIIAVSTLFSTPIVLALIALFIQLRKGLNFGTYLAIKTVAPIKIIRWTGIVLAYIAVTELLGTALERPVIPEFMGDAYVSAGSLSLLFIALVIAAPITEECLFRGFLLTGLSRSGLGWSWSIVICSLLWSLIHVQYDSYDITWIFLLGIILGFARKDSDSLVLPLFLHAVANILAFTVTAQYLQSS